MWRAKGQGSVSDLNIRVYYEDTDAGGVVYYANYLRFIERARTEWLRALGYDQSALVQTAGVVFAVRAVRAEFLSPARLDDELNLSTRVESIGRAQLVFHQTVRRGDILLFEADVKVACLNAVTFKPTAIPKDMHEKIKALI